MITDKLHYPFNKICCAGYDSLIQIKKESLSKAILSDQSGRSPATIDMPNLMRINNNSAHFIYFNRLRRLPMNERVNVGTVLSNIPARAMPFLMGLSSEMQKKASKKSWAIAGAILAALLIATAAWWVLTKSPQVTYTTAPVTRGAVIRSVTATGTVNPELTIIVGTYVSGVIQQLYCDYNTQVKKGQVCAKIDPRPYQTVVDQNKANLAIAKAQLEKDKASLTYLKLTYDRAARLVQTNAVSQDAVDSAKSNYDQALGQIVFDEATIQQRQAALDAAQVNLDYTDIISPVDGTVVSRSITMGQTVAASFQTPTLFLIATDLAKMEVDTNVSESDIGGVKVGDKATFTVDAFPKRIFSGTVTQVRQSPQTVQNIVTYDVLVSVDNTDLALKPGMTASSRIVTSQRIDTLRVPNQALRYSPSGWQTTAKQPGTEEMGQAQIFVLREGNPLAVPVIVGLDDDNFTEIVSGDIKPGDLVIAAEQTTTSSRTTLPRLRF
jgi:HlyD family secretion protein